MAKSDLFNFDLSSMAGEPGNSQIEIDINDSADDTSDGDTGNNDTNQDIVIDDGEPEMLIDTDSFVPGLTNSDTDDDDSDTESDNETDNTDDKNGEDDHTGSENDSPSPLNVFAQLLKEKEVLSNLDVENFDGTEEGLINAVYDEIGLGVNQYKESLPPRIKELINNYEDGVALETLLKADANVVKYSKITGEQLEEDVDLQRQIATEYLKRTTKFSDAKIKKEIEKSETLGTLEVDAKDALPELQKFDADEIESQKRNLIKQQKEQEQAQEAIIQEIGQKIAAAKEIIPGLKLDKASRTRVFNSMTQPVDKDEHGNPISKVVKIRNEDPIGFEMALHYLVDITKGFKDFSKLQTGAKKAAISDLEKAARGLTTKSGNGARRVASEPDVVKKNGLLESLRKSF